MSLGQFVEPKFAPEHISVKRLAGRAHFHGILKYIMSPAAVDRIFRMNGGKTNARRRAIAGWPYLDSLQLCDVTPEAIQNLLSTALAHGYSPQTAIHIRNVLHAIFSHARKAECFAGENPAHLAVPPGIARKEARTLTLAQLNQIIPLMRYPEREVALFGVITGMSVAEICGLKWKYIDLSDFQRMVDGEWIPAKAIAVRNQSYRGEFGLVMKNRRRILSLPELLRSALQPLQNRKRFTAPDDFVLASRSGTPISQDNIAARRLKSIGKSLDIPWLSWQVFHRTHVILNPEFWRQLSRVLTAALPHEFFELQPGGRRPNGANVFDQGRR